MKIVIATHNEHKLEEFKELMNSEEIELVSLKNYEIDMESVIENGEDFKDNALIKASFVANQINEFVLADDSGLVLDNFDILGVKTARFHSELPYLERHKIVYDLVKDSPKASFKCAICLISPSKEIMFFEGEAKGEIREPFGIEGFAYDPIFYSYDLNERFSNVSLEEKNKISHRGRAIKKMLNELKERGLINE